MPRDMQKKAAYQKVYQKIWYARNKERHKADSMRRTAIYKARVKGMIRTYKLYHPCKCGEDDPACLQFHHRDSTQKEFTIADICKDYRCLEKVEKEIAKCDVLCANCHLKLHHKLRHPKVSIQLELWP